jgi:hypothetical protein
MKITITGVIVIEDTELDYQEDDEDPTDDGEPNSIEEEWEQLADLIATDAVEEEDDDEFYLTTWVDRVVPLSVQRSKAPLKPVA